MKRDRGRPTGLQWQNLPRELPAPDHARKWRWIGFWLILLFFGYAALAPSTGCNKYAGIAAAYRTTIMVEQGIREADPHVAAWLRRAKAACAKSAQYAACIKPTEDKARAFVAAGKANRTAQDAIRAVHLGISKGSVIKIAAAGLCAALGALGVIAQFLPKVAVVVAKLKVVKGVACGLNR